LALLAWARVRLLLLIEIAFFQWQAKALRLQQRHLALPVLML
jgi:hypothetical protein